MKKKKFTWIIILIIILICSLFYFLVLKNTKLSGTNTEIANPAAGYCVEQGNSYEIRTDYEGNEFGVCINNEKECEEWKYFRGECTL